MSRSPDLGRLFAPRAVALVGMPGDLSRPGARPLHYLRRHGYGGRIYLVNPRHREIGGLPAYPSLAALPEQPDVAWIGVPATQAHEAIRECGGAGIPFAVVLGAGFAEAGELGESEQRRVAEAARKAGVRLCGPNTVGFVNAWERVALTFSTVGEIEAFSAGPLVLLSQSGGVGGALFNRALDRAVGVGLFVSTGNEADLTLADYLEWVVEDGRARAVACLVEQIRAPERFGRAVGRAAARGIAVVALKLGGSETGSRAARSHTGALVGRRDAWRAWTRAVGVLEAPDLDELVETAAYLARTPALEGSRVGLVTSSGGVAVLLADALEPRGFTFPPLAPETVARVTGLLPPYATVGNPLDITAGLPDETFGQVLDAVIRDPGLDAVVVPLTMATTDRGRARAEQVVKAARGVVKPLAVCWIGGSLVAEGFRTLDEGHAALFHGAKTCAAALGASLDHRAIRARRIPNDSAGSAAADVRLPRRGGALSWDEVQALLDAVAIPRPLEVVVRTEAEARVVAATCAVPAVVKLLGPVHKTEAGGVRLGLADGEAVMAAVRDLLPRGEGCLIQPMLDGVEVLVGALRDEGLGVFVIVAPGGINAELYRERAMRPVPVSQAEAEAALDETPGLAARLAGYRGARPVDRRALLDVIVRASVLAAALGDRLVELDLNPVIVGRTGATVVDARIVLEEG